MSASRLIGLSGKKRHGKDSFAARLVAEHGYRRVAFADNLRTAALALDPLILLEHEHPGLSSPGGICRLSGLVERVGWEAAKAEREVRRTLQRLGVAIRELDEEFWIRAALRDVPDYSAPHAWAPDPVVITDCRFPNEADAVRSRGGLVVRLVRLGYDSPVDEHPSETALDDWPFDVVFRCSTVAEVESAADSIIHD